MNIIGKIPGITKYLKNKENFNLKKNENRKNGPKRPKMENGPKTFFRRTILIKKQKK